MNENYGYHDLFSLGEVYKCVVKSYAVAKGLLSVEIKNHRGGGWLSFPYNIADDLRGMEFECVVDIIRNESITFVLSEREIIKNAFNLELTQYKIMALSHTALLVKNNASEEQKLYKPEIIPIFWNNLRGGERIWLFGSEYWGYDGIAKAIIKGQEIPMLTHLKEKPAVFHENGFLLGKTYELEKNKDKFMRKDTQVPIIISEESAIKYVLATEKYFLGRVESFDVDKAPIFEILVAL